MNTINVELPEAMMRWVEDETAQRGFVDGSEIIRRLIGRELERKVKIADMQRLVDEARAEPPVEMTMDEILKEVRERAHARRRDAA